MSRAFVILKSVRHAAGELFCLSSRLLKSAADICILTLALEAAFLLRFEGNIPADIQDASLYFWALVVPMQYGLCMLLQVTNSSWRYSGLREASRAAIAISAGAAALLGLRTGLHLTGMERFVPVLPAGIMLIDAAMGLLGLLSLRAFSRWLMEHAERQPRGARAQAPTRALLIGAGQAGWLVARELAAHPRLQLQAVGFLDDDAQKKRTRIYGLPVLGAIGQLPEIVRQTRAGLVILAIAHAPGHLARRVNEMAKEAGVPVKVVPGISEIVAGHVRLSRIRDVSIEDLLRREPVVFEDDTVREDLTDARVMVTGAGGSIGSEICRQICRYSPKKLILVEKAENPLFYIARELQDRFPNVPLELCIADICDAARMESLFAEHRPEAVFHAAAHKHVPMMEANPGEAIKNNVLGTRTVADLAHRYKAGRFVMISTDKAINPTSVMGVSKRVAEVYIQALSQRSECRFVTVRFGNVLGSSGSVIPIFQEQIARGGPVTVTHPEMRRYFMTIPEASQLVLQAGAMGLGGEIFILDMGEPVKIVNLARDLIRLSGLRPGEDIEIRFTGMRPGEKLFEELSASEEQTAKTRHPRIFIGHYRVYAWNTILTWIEDLRAVSGHPPAAIREMFQKLVPEYTPDNRGATKAPSVKLPRDLSAAPARQVRWDD